MGVKVKDDSILTNLEIDIDKIPKNEVVMQEIHQTFAIYMDPYVPMDEGWLSIYGKVTPEYVHYISPYAHYQYTGIVYGPNIPIFENGVIVSWYSPPNKYPTNKPITYSTEKHPKATHHWDKAMMKDKSKEFTHDVKQIISDYLNKQKGD